MAPQPAEALPRPWLRPSSAVPRARVHLCRATARGLARRAGPWGPGPPGHAWAGTHESLQAAAQPCCR
eukprot:11192836-Lingulodinium_polyedra.AAC.1